MKLAKEIWKAIFEDLYGRAEFDWWWDGADEDTARDINTTIRLIIAAKLEPVKKALDGLIETCESSDVQEFGEMPDKAAIRLAQAALSMLSEEE